MKSIMLNLYRAIIIIILTLGFLLLTLSAGLFLLLRFMELYPPYTMLLGILLCLIAAAITMYIETRKKRKRRYIAQRPSHKTRLSIKQNEKVLNSLLSHFPHANVISDNVFRIHIINPGHYIECTANDGYISVAIVLEDYCSYNCEEESEELQAIKLSNELDDLLNDRLIQINYLDIDDNRLFSSLCTVDKLNEVLDIQFNVSPSKPLWIRVISTILLIPSSNVSKAVIRSAYGTRDCIVYANSHKKQ